MDAKGSMNLLKIEDIVKVKEEWVLAEKRYWVVVALLCIKVRTSKQNYTPLEGISFIC